ncbi:MAG: hypothetical protein A2X36_00185 [Elusimicrobia bacterium GWA2_69_24]|nr:MAG: hypothetical protein A2X36_00185 [Elusimicrobia bacterium GWA2_69_24]HBL17283.1 hypothetical protein [Elusimicrobiota bacterium]
MRKAILIGLLLLPARAFAAGGGDPFVFLLLPTDARSVGLGGSAVALSADAGAVFRNPGALADSPHNGAAFMHNQHFEGVRQQVFSTVFRNGLGFGVNRLSYGSIPRTTVSNPSGSGLGSYSAADLAVAAGYGRRLNSFMTLGAALKYVQSDIAGFSARGAALDAGGRLELEPIYEVPLVLGWAVQNLGLVRPRYASTTEDFPTVLRLGAAYDLAFLGQKLTAAFELDKEANDDVTLHPGLEWLPVPWFAARAGYDGRNQAGPGVTAGVGWRLKDLSLDYAFVPFGDLGDSHRIGISMRWGGGPGGAVPGARLSTFRGGGGLSPAPARKVPFSPYRPIRFEPEPRIGG